MYAKHALIALRGSEFVFILLVVATGTARAQAGFAPRELRLSVKPRDAQSIRLALDIGRVAAAIDVVAHPALLSTYSPSSTMLRAEQIAAMPIAQRTSLPDAIAGAAHGDGESHEHASGAGLCAARCEARFTQNLSLGWNPVSSAAGRPRLAIQFNVENASNKVYLLSKESTMVQGQYSSPRLVSGSVRLQF